MRTYPFNRFNSYGMVIDMKYILLNLFFHISVIFILSAVRSLGCPVQSGDKDCLDLLPEGYKKYVPPKYKGSCINVTYSLVIYDLDEINEGTMDFRLHGYLRTDWYDERLIVNSTINNNRCSEHLWVPDVIFEQAKETKMFGTRNSLLFISKEKHLKSAERYSFKIGCLMFFEHYPFDTQRCTFSLVLMSTSDQAVKLRWDDGTGYPAVFLIREIEPLQFHLGELKTFEITNGYNGANYTYLYLNITLVRRLTGSIVNIFAPSTLIVAVSWVTFWLKLEAAPARVALSITSLLTLCTQTQQNKSQLPPLNYITAVDIWLFTCIFMVFASLVEFAISYNSFTEKQRKEMSEPSAQQLCRLYPQKINSWTLKKRLELEGNDPGSTTRLPKLKPRTCCFSWTKCFELSNLDSVCQKLFPLSFLIFAIIYWVHYLKIYNQP